MSLSIGFCILSFSSVGAIKIDHVGSRVSYSVFTSVVGLLSRDKIKFPFVEHFFYRSLPVIWLTSIKGSIEATRKNAFVVIKKYIL